MKNIMKRALALVLALVFVLSTAETTVVYAAPNHHNVNHSHSNHKTEKKHAHVFNRAVTEKWTEATCEDYATQTWACSQYVTKNGKKVLCEEEVTIVTGNKLAHKFVSTATEESEGVYQCSCGLVQYEVCKWCRKYSVLGFIHVPHTVVKVAPKLPHTHVVVEDAAVDATCTTTGLTAGSHCETCGEVFVAQEVVEATGHDEVVVPGADATCMEAGLTEGSYCGTCGEVFVAQEVIAAKDHEWQVLIDYSGCEHSGEKVSKCVNCGTRKCETAPATGHTKAVVAAKAPTCTENGYKEYQMCTKCGMYWNYVVVPATGHDEVVVPGVDATCTSTGLTEGSYCGTCNEVLVEQEVIEVSDHNWEVLIDYSSCEISGEKVSKCETCKLRKFETAPASGHTYATVAAKAPTCTEAGYEEYTMCTKCGKYWNYVEIPAAHTNVVGVPYKHNTPVATTHACGDKICLDCNTTVAVHVEVCMYEMQGEKCPGWCMPPKCFCETAR